ncbi:DoxX family membrane protein [Flagellimonas alvinocaridis]|uniref:DoxX family membrane protein n=1 Tax=Flagellimonas alvinocaridis TaxID=2530200 RepID=A0A4S8RTJ3_9FLAO|nr:DoxX family membrane protein [Allomuricauda alvinocaridis]THV57254.1 DoxX family membrane protein [Allomuricauda alvinocaridis]
MKQKIITVVSVLFGLMFINAGLNKFFNYMPVPEDLPESLMQMMQAIMTMDWLIPLVGFVELVGGMLFLFKKTRALGAIVILPVMVGILLINTVTDTSGLPIALPLFAINLWVIIENWPKYKPMFQS